MTEAFGHMKLVLSECTACSIQNTTLTTTAVVSFSDIDIKSQRSFFKIYFLKKLKEQLNST